MIGCGEVRVADPGRSENPEAQVPLRCARSKSADLVAIEGVDDRSVIVSSCGDVMYERIDGSVWLRRSDGFTQKLAENGRVQAFSAAGDYASFLRTGGTNTEGVLLDLATGVETNAGVSVRLAFGFDRATGRSVPFSVRGDGIAIFDESKFVPLAGTADLVAGDHAPYGGVMLAHAPGRLYVVDLVAQTVLHVQGIDYRRSGPTNSDGSSRGDDVYLSLDGRVVYSQPTWWELCGDTVCPHYMDPSLFETREGREIARSIGTLPQPTFGTGERDPRARDGIYERASTLVRAPSNPIFSVDTHRGLYTRHEDATFRRILTDGRVALVRTDGGASRVVTVPPGSSEETTLADITEGGLAEGIAVAPSGDAIGYMHKVGCVKVPDSESCWEAGVTMELVLLSNGNETARFPGFAHAGFLRIDADGSAIVSGTRFVGPPPNEAEHLDLESGTFRVAPNDGIKVIEGLDPNVLQGSPIDISSHWIAFVTHEYTPGKGRVQRGLILHTTTLELREVVRTDGFVRVVTPLDEDVRGMLVFVATREDLPAVLWHGVPPGDGG